MKVQVYGLLLLMGLPSTAVAQQAGVNSQIKIPPDCLVDGARGKERIIAGTVTEVRPGSKGGPLGTVESASSATISVDHYMQGPHFANDSVTLPVDWTQGHSKPWILRKPLWYDVNVKPGEKLLLTVITAEQAGASDPSGFRTSCVFEFDDYSSTVPTIEEMVFLDSTEGSAEVATPQRLKALEAIISAYDSSAAQTRKANNAIRSFITERIGDSDPRVRNAAIRWVYSKVLSERTSRLNPAWIWISNRDEVLKQLRSEASDGPLRREAARLLQFFGCQSATNSSTCKLC